MLNFGSTNGGGASGDFFWKFISGVAGDIELKTANGITGINALNPQNVKISLFLSSLFGRVLGGNLWQDGDKVGFSGVSEQGGVYGAQIVGFDTSTGETTVWEVNDSLEIYGQIESGNDIHIIQLRANSDGVSVGDISTGNNIRRATSSEGFIVEKQVGGVVTINFGIHDLSNRFLVTDGVAQRFAIAENGNIQTDQAAAAALKVPNGNYIEIFDMAGASLGFIQLTA